MTILPLSDDAELFFAADSFIADGVLFRFGADDVIASDCDRSVGTGIDGWVGTGKAGSFAGSSFL